MVPNAPMNRRIGIVDDDPSIRRAVKRLLSIVGFTVVTFGSGEDLLAWDGLAALDCLVLDVQLTGLSGFDVQDCLAAREISVPVIFITAHDDAATRERARRRPSCQYLRKPFDERTLVDAIHTAIGDAMGP